MNAPSRLILLISVLFSLNACTKDEEQQNEENVPAQNISNHSYGSDVRNVMDIYLPANRSKASTKTMVFVHGGAWQGGDKSEFNASIDTIRKVMPGYAFVNINYRLAANGNVNVFPAQENDIKNAIESYLARSDEYKVSKDLVLVGASAGAHLVMLHAYKHDPDRHVKAVVDFFGPTDLEQAWNSGPLAQLLLWQVTGKGFTEAPELYRNSSPINYITSNSPPTIMLQGGADPIVAPVQTDLLEAKLKASNVPNQKVFYPNEGHGFGPVALSDAITKSIAFIRTHVD